VLVWQAKGIVMSASARNFRRSERIGLVLPARCRSRSGFVDRVVIADLSCHGCRIESFALTMHQGDLVVITPHSLEGICGTVRWVSGHSAGIEFASPLYAPVVEHLGRQYRNFLPPRGMDCARMLRMAA
jgi:PilZ domain